MARSAGGGGGGGGGGGARAPAPRHRALFAFSGGGGDGRTLPFSKGEELVVLRKQVDAGDGWWEGRTKDGRTGLFPAKYVEVIQGPTLPAILLQVHAAHFFYMDCDPTTWP